MQVIKGKLAGFLPEEDTDDGGYESHGGGLSPRRQAKIASRFTFAPSRHAASLTPTASALTALPVDAPPVPIARSLTQIPQIAPDNTVREFEAPEVCSLYISIYSYISKYTLFIFTNNLLLISCTFSFRDFLFLLLLFFLPRSLQYSSVNIINPLTPPQPLLACSKLLCAL